MTFAATILASIANAPEIEFEHGYFGDGSTPFLDFLIDALVVVPVLIVAVWALSRLILWIQNRTLKGNNKP